MHAASIRSFRESLVAHVLPIHLSGKKAFTRGRRSDRSLPRQVITRNPSVTEMYENVLGTLNVDRAVHLHQDLGPGPLETVEEVTLAANPRKRGFSVEHQVPSSIE